MASEASEFSDWGGWTGRFAINGKMKGAELRVVRSLNSQGTGIATRPGTAGDIAGFLAFQALRTPLHVRDLSLFTPPPNSGNALVMSTPDLPTDLSETPL